MKALDEESYQKEKMEKLARAMEVQMFRRKLFAAVMAKVNKETMTEASVEVFREKGLVLSGFNLV